MKEVIFVLLLLFECGSASNWRISQLVDKCPDRNAHLYFSVHDEIYERAIDSKKPQGDVLLAGYNNHYDDQIEEDVHDIISMTYNTFHHSLLYIKEEPKPRVYEFILRNDSWDYYDFDDDLHFKELSFDSVTGNLYYLAQDNSIGACILRESKCETIVEATRNSSARFRDLVLYPELGLMLWIRKEDDDRTLQMASMNGEKIHTVEHLSDVRAVTIDQENGLVFVANKTDILELDLDMNWRELDSHKISTTSMLYFDCKLYYIDRNRRELMSFQLNEPGQHLHEVIAFDTPLTVGVNSKRLNRLNPCLLLKCDGICVIGEENQSLKATCICKACSNSAHSGWLVAGFFILLLAILVALFLLIEFRLVPALSDFVDRQFRRRKQTKTSDAGKVLIQINARDE